MEKTQKTTILFLSFIVAVLLLAASAARANITIAIPDNLDGWSYPSDLHPEYIFAQNGHAVLREDEYLGPRDLQLTSDPFLLSAGTHMFSFDLTISSGFGGETDIFNVNLIDCDTGTALTPVSSSFTLPWNNHGLTDPIVIQETVDINYLIQTDPGETHRNVCLDFILNADGNAAYTSVVLTGLTFTETSSTPKIPAPAALLMACLGSGLLITYHRSRRILFT